MFKKFKHPRFNVISFIVASAVMTVASLFMGYKNGKFDMVYADAISDHNFLQGPFIPNDINIQAIHTHILKWPVALFENAIGFNETTHIITSVVLLLLMNFGLAYIFYRFSKKNLLTTSIAMLLLVSVELTFGLFAGEGSLSMITIRNIEIPLIIGALLVFFTNKKALSWNIIAWSLVIGIIFLSDHLLFYTSVIGAIFYFGVQLLAHKGSFKKTYLSGKGFYLGIAYSTIVCVLLTLIVSLANLADLFSIENPGEDKLLFANSFMHQFDILLANIDKIFAVFGAHFFGQPVKLVWIYAINVLLLAVGTVLITKAIKHSKKVPKNTHEAVILSLIFMYFIAMLIFSVIIPRELAGRYFVFLPVITILLLCVHYQKLKIPQFGTIGSIGIYSLVVVLVPLFFAGLIVKTNETHYRPAFAIWNERALANQYVVDSLIDNEAVSLISIYGDGKSFWESHVIKNRVDERTNTQLAISSVFCGGNVVDKNFSKRSWNEPTGGNVVILVKGCDVDSVVSIFGEPRTIKEHQAHDGALLIYDKDVRDNLNLIQYEENLFVTH